MPLLPLIFAATAKTSPLSGFVTMIYVAIGVGAFGGFAVMSLNIYFDLKAIRRKKERKELQEFQKTKKKQDKINAAKQGFTAASSLYTEAEKKFHEVLRTLKLEGIRINGKTRLADIAQAPEIAGKTDIARFNMISQKHVDFLLVDESTQKPLLVIELDDRSHQRPDRQARDELVDAILAECGIPILHQPCQHYYEAHTVKKRILEKIANPTPHKTQSTPPPNDQWDSSILT